MKSYRVLVSTGLMLKSGPATAWAGSVVDLEDNEAKDMVAAGWLVPVDEPVVETAVVAPPPETADAPRAKGKSE